MIERLKEICRSLEQDGFYDCIKVIPEIYHDGGGSPVFLRDVITYLEYNEMSREGDKP